MSSSNSQPLSTTPPPPPYYFPTAPHNSAPFPPFLTTSRLTLTLMNSQNDSDLEISLKLINDPINEKQTGRYGIDTKEKLLGLLHACRLYPVHCPDGKTEGSCVYLVRLKGTEEGKAKGDNRLGDAIGMVSIVTRDLNIPPDIGWALLPSYHRQGYAPEAASALLHWYLNDFYVPAGTTRRQLGLIALPNIENLPSVKSAEKIGLVYMGEVAPLTEPTKATVVYGTPGRGINGGKMFTTDTVMSFFGPGEDGEKLKRLVMGDGAGQNGHQEAEKEGQVVVPVI